MLGKIYLAYLNSVKLSDEVLIVGLDKAQREKSLALILPLLTHYEASRRAQFSKYTGRFTVLLDCCLRQSRSQQQKIMAVTILKNELSNFQHANVMPSLENLNQALRERGCPPESLSDKVKAMYDSIVTIIKANSLPSRENITNISSKRWWER